jgi:hypothetical protein
VVQLTRQRSHMLRERGGFDTSAWAWLIGMIGFTTIIA